MGTKVSVKEILLIHNKVKLRTLILALKTLNFVIECMSMNLSALDLYKLNLNDKSATHNV